MWPGWAGALLNVPLLLKDGEKGWKGFPTPALPKEENSMGWEESTLFFVFPGWHCCWIPAFFGVSLLSLFPQPEQSDAVTREGFTARSKFDLFPQTLYKEELVLLLNTPSLRAQFIQHHYTW